MKPIIWDILLLLVGLAALLIVWRFHRRRRRTRLISFVGLLKEPVEFDAAVLARVAGQVWDAKLGDGTNEGAEGFVAGIGPMSTIVHKGRMVLINCIPKTYVDDLDGTAEGIADLRIRSLFLKHEAWFSCDALGVDGTTTEQEVRDWYRRLGKLFAELLDDNALLIFLPDSNQAFPINEDTEAALRSKDPVRALQETLTVPIVEVSEDDPLMKQAVEQARQSWPEFVSNFDAGSGENFSVKAPVSHSGQTEFIWIAVTAIEAPRIYGTLGNDPNDLGPLKLGSKVSVAVADLNDWCYLDAGGELKGGFTIKAVQKAARKPRKE